MNPIKDKDLKWLEKSLYPDDYEEEEKEEETEDIGTDFFSGKRQKQTKEEEEFWEVEDVFDEWDIYWKTNTWIRYHNMFNDSIGVILDTIDNLTFEQKLKVIERLGEKIDEDIKELKLKTGRAISFTERARRLVNSLKYANEMKDKKPEIIEKIRAPKKYDRVVKKIKSENYVLSPRSYNYLLLKLKRGQGKVLLPDYSPQGEALIDVIFHHLAEKMDYGFKKLEEEFQFPFKDFSQITKNPKESQLPFYTVFFEISDIRKKLNSPKRWTNEVFVKAAHELRDKPIHIKASKIWANEAGKYKDKINWRGSFLSDAVEMKRDRLKPETENVKHKLALCLGRAGWLLFMNDVMRQKYSMFPTKKKGRIFYRMKRGVTRLSRYLSLWDETTLTVIMAMDILNYSQNTDIDQIIKRVQGYLEEMTKSGLIKGWIREGKGINTRWHIGVKSDLGDLHIEAEKRGLLHSK